MSDMSTPPKQVCSNSIGLATATDQSRTFFEQSALPRLLLLGRPNVGKSTLYNRIVGRREALTNRQSGTTRDCRSAIVTHSHFRWLLVDSGGVTEPTGATSVVGDDYDAAVSALAWQAAQQATLVWMVVSAREGLHPIDMQLSRQLRRMGKPFWVLVNKIDHPRHQDHAAEFYELAPERLAAVSAVHGHGIAALLKTLPQSFEASETDQCEQSSAPNEEAAPISMMLIGRPNAGKSSLANALLGADRMLVAATAGTTREAIRHPFFKDGQPYVLIDSAGLRRKARVPDGVEKLGALHSLEALRKADVGVLVIDGTQPVVEQDQKIAAQVLKYKRAVVVALTKQDLIKANHAQQKTLLAAAHKTLHFLDFAVFVTVSAVSGDGLDELMSAVREAALQFKKRVSTADVNRVLEQILFQAAPPPKAQSPTKVFYGTQVRQGPPQFRFFSNHPEHIPVTYNRFVERKLRYYFGFQGTPIEIQWQARH